MTQLDHLHNEETDIVEISPRRTLWRIDIQELWQRHYLIRLLIRKDILASHKQSILGPAWFVLQPVITSLLFVVFFGMFAGLSPRGVPRFLFYLSAMIPWTLFTSINQGVSGCLMANASILGKVYFPRMIMPVVAVGTAGLHFLFKYGVFVIFYISYVFRGTVDNNLHLLDLPLMILILLFISALGLGTGLIFASFSVRYRDFRIALPVLLQTWMFATPVIYPSTMIPEKWKSVFYLNPMAGFIETHRHVVLGTPRPSLLYIIQGAGITGIILLIGLTVFHRAQRNFVDVL